MPHFQNRIPDFRISTATIIAAILAFSMPLMAALQADDTTAVEQIQLDAKAFRPLVKSDITKSLLDAFAELPTIDQPRIVYYNRDTRKALSQTEYSAQNLDTTSGYKRNEFEEDFYYFTRYGTPVAFTRALDLVGSAGLKSLDGAKVCEYGFGSIGQLRAMASLGADVTGIEVDPILEVLYSGDSGSIPRSKIAGKGKDGNVRMLFGSFPSDTAVFSTLGNGYDLFVSKNTLKRGYVHPEKDVDPRMLVHLGVSDTTFVKTVYDMLKPGGYFMIYNLHPKYTPPTAEKYIPWSDGRSPFDKSLLEQTGFEVLTFDTNDTEFAHQMAKAFGWDKSMNLENDLFGMYTLLRKK